MNIGIVSSYEDSCGNASFTRALEDSIREYTPHSIKVIDIDYNLLRSADVGSRKAGDVYVEDLCRRIASFDGVNIQLEASLYGRFPSDIYRRLRKLISANKRTTITLHSPRILATAPYRPFFSYALRFRLRRALGALLAAYRANEHVYLNRKLIALAAKRKRPLIVHTLRAKKQIESFYGYGNILVHPLKIVRDGYAASPLMLEEIKRVAGIGENVVVIGLFGYISKYKGHADALDALRILPDKYHLIICGRQHPQTIRSDGTKDEYLSDLVRVVQQDPKLATRVFFVGELDDGSFRDTAANVDIVWLPYHEVGQDGSGVASICMDLAPRVVASSSFAFDEVLKLLQYNNVVRFDIGNAMELAFKTEMMMERTPAPLPHCTGAYTIATQAEVYIKALEESGRT